MSRLVSSVVVIMLLAVGVGVKGDESVVNNNNSSSNNNNNNSNSIKKELLIGGICVITNHWWTHARTFPVVLQSAFEDINNNSGILADYRLKLMMMDSQGLPALAMKAFFEFIHSGPPILMMVGPSKSESAVAVSEVTPAWNLVSVVYSARSATLDDRKRFPNIYRTNYNEASFNPARAAVLKYFDWNKVATITPVDEPFFSQMSSFISLLRKSNFTVQFSTVLSRYDNGYIREQIKLLKQSDARIIVANIYDLYVRQVLCEAYKAGLTGKNYVWIMMNWAATPGWPDKLDPVWGTPPNSTCTNQELHRAAHGYLALDQKYMSDSPEKTISGMTADEILRRSQALYPDELSHSHTYAYDAAWSVALALNTSIEKLAKLNKSLEDFTYEDSQMSAIFKESMEKLSFLGQSGPVSYSASGSRQGLTYINQWRDNRMVEVGHYGARDHSLVWNSGSAIVWPGGEPPKDSFERVFEERRLPDKLVWPMTVICIMGLCCAFLLLAYNVYYRQLQVIKMSSPNMNNLILLGALIIYVSVLVDGLGGVYLSGDKRSTLCNVQAWLVSLAFTTAFGSMLSKTWRVHVLFTKGALEKKVIKDTRLMLIVAILLAGDAVLLGLWMQVNPMRAVTVQAEESEWTTTKDTLTVPIYTKCECDNAIYWSIAIYAYKGLQLVFGSFLAWETRKVTIPGLNDSKTIGMCVYNTTVLCAFGVPIAKLLQVEQFVIKYALLSILELFCTTTTILWVFVPKIRQKNQQVKVGRFTQEGHEVSSTAFSGSGGTSAVHQRPTLSMGASAYAKPSLLMTKPEV